MKPFRLIVAAICLVVCAPAAAQYPNRPLRLVVPFPPGGAAEIACRSVAQALSLSLGQPVVVETKPGADGHRLLREITIALKRPEVQEQMQRVGFAAAGAGDTRQRTARAAAPRGARRQAAAAGIKSTS